MSTNRRKAEIGTENGVLVRSEVNKFLHSKRTRKVRDSPALRVQRDNWPERLVDWALQRRREFSQSMTEAASNCARRAIADPQTEQVFVAVDVGGVVGILNN